LKFCTSCGSRTESNATFCGNCGKPILRTNVSEGTGRLADVTSVKNNSQDHLAQAILVTSPSFISKLDQLLADSGARPFGIVAGLNEVDIKKKIMAKIKGGQPNQVRYICLIGSWDEVPIFSVPTPAGIDDGDDYCFTDGLYGCDVDYDSNDIFSAIPKYLVGRIPSTNLSVVKDLLFNGCNTKDAKQSFLFAVSAQCWSEATETIVNKFLGEPNMQRPKPDPVDSLIARGSVLSSPSWENDSLAPVINREIQTKNAVVLFNVHGGLDEPVWVGEGGYGYPKIFDTETVQYFNSSTLVCEACYGGALGYEPVSIVESFFEKGGLTFVGSSTIAYGAPNENIAAADCIALSFLQALSRGETVGEALNFAKTEVAKTDPLYDFIGKKTVLSFNLFGAPWLRRPIVSSVGRTTSIQVDATSRLGQIRSRNTSLNLDRDNTLGKIRDRYRSHLSEQNKRFFLEQDKARNEIKRFKDYEKISNLVSDWTGDPDDFTMQYLSNNGEEGYALSSQALGHGKSKKTMILLIDSDGKLKKTITSKGKGKA